MLFLFSRGVTGNFPRTKPKGFFSVYNMPRKKQFFWSLSTSFRIESKFSWFRYPLKVSNSDMTANSEAISPFVK